MAPLSAARQEQARLPRPQGRKSRRPSLKAVFPLAQRPSDAADPQDPGHWEADLMMFARYGQAILTLHERFSRLLLAARPPGKAAQRRWRAISQAVQRLAAELRQTITFDNGTEFARHSDLHRHAMATFFCDPYAPWQKGGIENAIGRMRRALPRKTDLAALSQSTLPQPWWQPTINTPRKCLDWSTPAEAFSQVLHFKCEIHLPAFAGTTLKLWIRPLPT